MLWTGTRKVKNRVAVTLRMAAQSLQKSQSALGEFYRRMRTRLGAPKAITAGAHKVARIIYHMLKTREPYDESVFARAESRHRQRAETRLNPEAWVRSCSSLARRCTRHATSPRNATSGATLHLVAVICGVCSPIFPE